MEISLAGGSAVVASFLTHTVRTDQPRHSGGEDSAPSPFDLFLASIGTCAGYYVGRFCQQRQIPTDELRITLEPLRDPQANRVDTIRLEVKLPREFPERYRKAILRAVDQCSVKRHIIDPPGFEVVLADSG